MNTKIQKFLTRVGMLALVAFLALPLTALAQDNGRGRDSQWRQQEARRQQEERNRAAAILRQQEAERLRAEELRLAQERNRNNGWGNNNNNDRNRRGRNWDRFGTYGGSFQLRQTALNAGYNNGIEEGRKDRRRGDRFDYRDEGDFQKATEDYSSRLGDRELYKRYFREGFANGYEDGYRGY
jgi:type II secretory pathway pseudopilin PulG